MTLGSCPMLRFWYTHYRILTDALELLPHVEILIVRSMGRNSYEKESQPSHLIAPTSSICDGLALKPMWP